MNEPAVVGDGSRHGVLPPSGEQYEIRRGPYEAVVTEVGATLRSFTVHGDDVVDGFDVQQMSSAGRGQVLAPWPNRLEDGSFSRYGVEANAALDESIRSNAIHGLVRWLPWSLRADDAASVELGCVLHPQPGYPWRLDLSVTYAMGPDGLHVTTTATNLSDGPAPFGVGFHPYVKAADRIDDAFLTIPAMRRLLSDDRGLPTADEAVAGTAFDFTVRRSIGTTQLDTAFTDLLRDRDGRVRVRLERSDRNVTVWADRAFDYLMVYTGDTLQPPDRRRHGIAIEPMTCPPNALRTGIAVIRLQPGGSWTGAWGIDA